MKNKEYLHPNNRHTQIVVALDEKGILVGECNLAKIRSGDKNYRTKLSIAAACRSESHKYKKYFWYYKVEYEKAVKAV